MSKGSWKKETKQEQVYERYITTNMSLQELAEEFGVAYSSINTMLCRERKKRGTYVPRTRR